MDSYLMFSNFWIPILSLTIYISGQRTYARSTTNSIYRDMRYHRASEDFDFSRFLAVFKRHKPSLLWQKPKNCFEIRLCCKFTCKLITNRLPVVWILAYFVVCFSLIYLHLLFGLAQQLLTFETTGGTSQTLPRIYVAHHK